MQERDLPLPEKKRAGHWSNAFFDAGAAANLFDLNRQCVGAIGKGPHNAEDRQRRGFRIGG